MKVILHIGAHRTGTTTFQAYVRKQSVALSRQNIGFWGPARTRKGLFAGLQPLPCLGRSAAQRARGRILLQLDKTGNLGVDTLVVSDENMMGNPRLNLRSRTLYADVGERLSRYVAGFDGHIEKVVLSVRSLDDYWASTMAYGVGRGHAVPGLSESQMIAYDARTWRDVITDVACAAQGAPVEVIPFETSVGRPDLTLSACTGLAALREVVPDWLNRRPQAQDLRAILADRGEDPDQVPEDVPCWTPFDARARAALREAYADDMHWLVAGADGLATLTENMDQICAGTTLPHGPLTRGQEHEQERRMAQPR